MLLQKINRDIRNAFLEAIDLNSNKRIFAKMIIDGDMTACRCYCNYAQKNSSILKVILLNLLFMWEKIAIAQ